MTIRPTVWLAEFLANLGATTGTQELPTITALTNGNFLVTWTDLSNNVDTAPQADIIGQLFDPLGNRINGPFQLNGFQADNEDRQRVTALPGGGFAVSYVDFDGAEAASRLSIYNAAGVRTFSGTVEEPDINTKFAVTREVVEIGNGLIAVLYVHSDTPLIPSLADIEHRVEIFNSAGVSQGLAFQRDFESGDVDLAHLSGLSMVFVEAHRPLFASADVIETFVAAPGGFQSALGPTITAPAGVEYRDVAVTRLEDPGQASSGFRHVTVWISTSGQRPDVKFSIFNNNATTRSETFVTPDTEVNAQPEVIGLADGGFFIVWIDETNGQIEGRRFSTTGAAVGSTLVIGAGTGLENPQLDLTDDGRILVAWTESGDIRSAILDPRVGTIVGTPLGDVLTGFTVSSTMSGLAGADRIFGSDFSDTVFGGDGDDTLIGRAGNDRLAGDDGNDTVLGGDGNDVMLGGAGADFHDGGGGVDRVDYSASPDSVLFSLGGGTGIGGDAAGDTYSGVEDAVGSQFGDVVTGTIGANVLTLLGGNDRAFGGDGDDDIRGFSGDDRMFGGNGLDRLIGDEGNDSLFGGAGADSIFGGDGDDLVEGGDGADFMVGGAGGDTLTYAGATFPVFVSLLAGGGIGGHAQGDTFSEFEHLIGSPFSDRLIGDNGGNVILGGEAGDFIDGLDGNDTLDGGNASDTLFGGLGNDVLDGGLGGDTMAGGGGNDRYLVDSAADVITGEIGFSQGGGIDRVESFVTFTLLANLEILALQGVAAISGFGTGAPESFVGNIADNTVDGAGGNDMINGKDGDDILIGGPGRDTLVGERGNDVFLFRDVGESLPGQASRDLINGFVHGSDRIDLSAIDADPFTAGDQGFSFIGGAAFSGLGAASAGQSRAFSFGGLQVVIWEADLDGDAVADMQVFINGTNFMTGIDFIL